MSNNSILSKENDLLQTKRLQPSGPLAPPHVILLSVGRMPLIASHPTYRTCVSSSAKNALLFFCFSPFLSPFFIYLPPVTKLEKRSRALDAFLGYDETLVLYYNFRNNSTKRNGGKSVRY